MKDYYKILGVEKGASKEEIKRAFHKLAHRYHPDKKGGDEAKFKEINEAYQTLSDDGKRSQYDNFGAMGGNGNAGGFDFSGFSGFGGNGDGVQFDLGDLFGDLFGGRGRSEARRGRDISVDIQISFAEAVFGTERQVLITKIGQCRICGGGGAKPGSKTKTCTVCGGTGKINETRRSVFGTFSLKRECAECHGSGKVPEEKCANCRGAGVLRQPEEIKINIPAGIENGEMIRLSGGGEAVAHGGVAGDLYIRVHVDKHPTLRRDGQNLLTDLNIKLSEAILGGEYKIESLDGVITLKIPAGIAYGEFLRIKDRGVPLNRGNKRGDLLVRVTFKTPNKISKRAKDLLEELNREGL